MTQDPTEERIVLNPQNLRALAHPLRVRLLGILREDGPSTATRLAERVGESSGATSYHLRQLALHGFVVEDTKRPASGRERWWRSAHRLTELRKADVRRAPIEAEGFLRAVMVENIERVDAFISALPTLPEEWDEGSSLSDLQLRLTPAESARLRSDLAAVVDRYRIDDPDVEAPAGAERVVIQIQLMPQLSRTR
jgi:DNA-binding transcriptional ArsR family regulator